MSRTGTSPETSIGRISTLGFVTMTVSLDTSTYRPPSWIMFWKYCSSRTPQMLWNAPPLPTNSRMARSNAQLRRSRRFNKCACSSRAISSHRPCRLPLAFARSDAKIRSVRARNAREYVINDSEVAARHILVSAICASSTGTICWNGNGAGIAD